MMHTDDPIEELHRVRQRIWEECDRDLDKYFERIKAREREHAERMTPPAPPRNWKLPEVKSEPVG